MFIVSSSNLMASFSGHHHSDFVGSSSALAELEIGQEAGDELNDLQFQTGKLSMDSSKSAAGGLRRTVSSLHSSLAPISPACSHANYKSNCIVEAKQVEMDFATLTNHPFQLTVTAPNGETGCYRFLNYGHTERFSPRLNGCGHGNWKFEIHTFDSDYKNLSKKSEEKIYLDGVGSLFFTIDEHLQIRLASQEFLRLPSASQCCSSKN
ncbi:hypothetical protein DdX_04749 [Ditylenchus destructor]|uniref:Uncharacterized protein n=1 Tax=Ditylenchus destructor TaxID=166010 RepID=A0AAD4ND39_9BILA|nr:hypothetical protein DdX_04749 [Ditylenchus destructor]